MIKTAFQEYYNQNIKMICIDDFKHSCYLILAGVMVDYKKQVLITIMKRNI